jgi:hypothetical protein
VVDAGEPEIPVGIDGQAVMMPAMLYLLITMSFRPVNYPARPPARRDTYG